jgi:hypothetical protein
MYDQHFKSGSLYIPEPGSDHFIQKSFSKLDRPKEKSALTPALEYQYPGGAKLFSHVVRHLFEGS